MSTKNEGRIISFVDLFRRDARTNVYLLYGR
jgi:hypothetical protein